MHRFIVTPSELTSSVVTLGEASSHHAAVVLRMRAGGDLQLLDGAGTVADGRVISVSRKAVTVEVTARHRRPGRGWQVVLAAAVTKGKAWDTLLVKATELDVSVIVPLLTRHCVVKVASAERKARQADWQGAVEEAVKQCGTPWMPKVSEPLTLTEWLRSNPPLDLGLVGALIPDSAEIGDVLAQHGPVRRVGIVIGPEGDFEPSELQSLIDAGFLPVTLGNTILRADTAAIGAVAVIAHELRRRWGR